MKLEGASTGLPRAPIDELSRVVSSRRRPADQLALCRAGSVQLALCSEPRAKSAMLRAQSSELPHRRDSDNSDANSKSYRVLKQAQTGVLPVRQV
jgi:hypothetical protein